MQTSYNWMHAYFAQDLEKSKMPENSFVFGVVLLPIPAEGLNAAYSSPSQFFSCLKEAKPRIKFPINTMLLYSMPRGSLPHEIKVR